MHFAFEGSFPCLMASIHLCAGMRWLMEKRGYGALHLCSCVSRRVLSLAGIKSAFWRK